MVSVNRPGSMILNYMAEETGIFSNGGVTLVANSFSKERPSQEIVEGPSQFVQNGSLSLAASQTRSQLTS